MKSIIDIHNGGDFFFFFFFAAPFSFTHLYRGTALITYASAAAGYRRWWWTAQPANNALNSADSIRAWRVAGGRWLLLAHRAYQHVASQYQWAAAEQALSLAFRGQSNADARRGECEGGWLK